MKKILSLGLFLLLTLQTFAQTDGITYQAVIIGPDVLELPGVNSEGNILPVTKVAIRFTIIDSGNLEEFQEVQITETDEFGRINLLIGDGNHDEFKKISWDGTPKDLKVEIDFEAGSNFVDMSRERLTFLPYAYHRNITATGTLDVDDNTFLNGELQVEGPTNLNSTLDVNNNNASNLTGDLTVGGATNLDSTLNVNNNSTTNLSGDLTVDGNTNLNGTLDVIGKTTVTDFEATGQSTFNDLEASTLQVNTSSTLLGTTLIDGTGSQVRITSLMTGTSNEIGNHPLLIDGGTNGLAIKVNGSRNNGTNFITFFDNQRTASWGRIEGEIPSEFDKNADYLFDKSSLNYDIFDAGFDILSGVWDTAVAVADNIAAASAAAPCVGPIPCVALPPPSFIISTKFRLIAEAVKTAAAIVGEGIAVNNLVVYNNNKDDFQGVTYASGAGDYAEYLLRKNVSEKMTYGDVVGVKGGEISKNLIGAERIMVISFKPIVLGNMPQPNHETEYEKVAFMGQVPVKVFGKVKVGDYIIPSGKNDGIGIAIAPSKININQIKDIVGIAWSENNIGLGFNLINVAVGLNRNDSGLILEKLENKVNEQAEEISYLKSQIENILSSIIRLEQGSGATNNALTNSNNKNGLTIENHSNRKISVVESPESDIIYIEITRGDIEQGLIFAENMMRDSGEYERSKEFFEKLENDSEYKKRFIDKLQEKLDKQLHYHKEIDKKGKH